MKKIVKILLTLIIICLIGGSIMLYLKYRPEVLKDEKYNFESAKAPKLSIYDLESKTRPYAVMIDNNVNAWPHSGINSAYLIYEMPVEGGETRLMALFKDKENLEKVGPIRSSRHYFLDYVLENNAIYTHLGQSPKAESDMGTLKIDRINGQHYDTLAPKKGTEKEFWRQQNKDRPHDAYTSLRNLKNIAESLNYKTESDKSPVLNYSVMEVNLGEKAKDATDVTIAFNAGNVTEYIYDKENKVYTKKAKDKIQKEELTGEKFTTKNIIVVKTKVTDLVDVENKGRKDVQTVGELSGYYITNGKAIEIKAKKESRAAKTKYMDLEGNEIKVNDGRTFIVVVSDEVGDIVIKGDAQEKNTAE